MFSFVYPVFIIANLGLDNSNFRFTANINLISLGVLFFEIEKDKKKKPLKPRYFELIPLRFAKLSPICFWTQSSWRRVLSYIANWTNTLTQLFISHNIDQHLTSPNIVNTLSNNMRWELTCLKNCLTRRGLLDTTPNSPN